MNTVVWHYIFKVCINYALTDFAAAFNNRPIRTENNWSPNKIRINGMINPSNERQTVLRDPAIGEAVTESGSGLGLASSSGKSKHG